MSIAPAMGGEELHITAPNPTSGVPRSRRVGMASPPSQFSLSLLLPTPSSPPVSPTSTSTTTTSPPASPPLPARSPLRPPARSISASTTAPATPSSPAGFSAQQAQTPPRPATPPPLDFDDFASITDAAVPLAFQMRGPADRESFPSMHTLVDSIHTMSEDGLGLPKALLRPDSPLSLCLDGNDSTSSSSSIAQAPVLTKRHHALHELLSSERAYASDLALIRTVHIPLALGQTVPLQQAAPASPPNSSASSSRTLSTASDSSIASLGPPLTQEDVNIIFSNIAELAVFSDLFSEELEEALGSVVEGGQGEDHVGALFLQIIPELERPYKHYITRHPTALSHLQSLPKSPALTAYLQHTQSVASSLSHAWDLASLLIKPVQRLLKYPLLLAAIIDETPESHADKENLKLARTRMEEVARNVNEGRRRAEVIKDVLSSSKKKPSSLTSVGVSASVNLSKMKSMRRDGGKALAAADANGEAALVERMHAELKRIDAFSKEFAKGVVDWSKMTSNVVLSLRMWAMSFGKVIGLSPDQESEAFNAFLAVVEQQLMPLCMDLEAVINERLLKEIARLLATMNQPLKLLASMNEQEPLHYYLLTMNVSAKNRPPASLLAASTNYLALRGQLAAELPNYLSLLRRGVAIFVRRLADIQAEFWRDVRDRWAELWEMLRVEGEMNAGHEETINVWKARWGDVDEVIGALNINQVRGLYREPTHARQQQSTPQLHSMLSSLDPSGPYSSHHKNQPKSAAVNSMLSSLEPAHAVGQYAVSGPYALSPSSRTRARGSSDASNSAPKKGLGRRVSNDSLRSGRSHKNKSPRRRAADDLYADHVPVMPAMPFAASHTIPRTKSMPLPPASEKPVRPPSSRTTTGGYGEDGHAVYRSQEQYDDRERGRPSRSASYKRKPAEGPPARRPSNSRRRSGSMKSFTSYSPNDPAGSSAVADPAPISSAQRDSWVNKPAKYLCQVIHPCKPPAAVSYFSFPFFTLLEGDFYEVLQEAGHPSIHPKLPLYVDDGEDCLLLCRNGMGNVGWALASFLEPVTLPD